MAENPNYNTSMCLDNNSFFISIYELLYYNRHKNREIQVKYVELMINILNQPIKGKNDPLRSWAVQVLNLYSPLKISKSTQEELINNRQLSIVIGNMIQAPQTVSGQLVIPPGKAPEKPKE